MNDAKTFGGVVSFGGQWLRYFGCYTVFPKTSKILESRAIVRGRDDEERIKFGEDLEIIVRQVGFKFSADGDGVGFSNIDN